MKLFEQYQLENASGGSRQWRLAMSIPTFGSMMEANRGFGPGFNFARLFLATAIIVWHAYFYTRPAEVAEAAWVGPFGPFLKMLVPLFFALSGFLVTGSFLRLRNLKVFVAFRVLRIIPALLIEVTISAIVLGGLLTTLRPSQYFTDPEFFSYFSNIVGHVQYELPGVFKHQYRDWVNAALWTIPARCRATSRSSRSR